MMSETWELRDQDNKAFQLRVFIEATTELWWATEKLQEEWTVELTLKLFWLRSRDEVIAQSTVWAVMWPLAQSNINH